MYVPHEVKNQRALVKRTSRLMKYGQDQTTPISTRKLTFFNCEFTNLKLQQSRMQILVYVSEGLFFEEDVLILPMLR